MTLNHPSPFNGCVVDFTEGKVSDLCEGSLTRGGSCNIAGHVQGRVVLFQRDKRIKTCVIILTQICLRALTRERFYVQLSLK